MTQSQMPSAQYYNKTEMYGGTINEKDLETHTMGYANENNHSVSVNTGMRSSMPFMPENDVEQYEHYFNEWAQSLK